MNVIILKKTQKPYSKRFFEIGSIVEVTGEYGRELIKKKKAGQVPQMIGGQWYYDGRPSTKMMGLRRMPEAAPLTIEEYLEYIKKRKN